MYITKATPMISLLIGNYYIINFASYGELRLNVK